MSYESTSIALERMVGIEKQTVIFKHENNMGIVMR